MRRAPAVVLLAALLAGAARAQEESRSWPERGRVPRRVSTRRPPRDEAEAHRLALFAERLAPFEYELRMRYEGRRWSIADVRFPSALKSGYPTNDTVRGRWFHSLETRGKRPALILLHHLENRFLLEEAIARALVERGVDVFLMYLPFYGPRLPAGVNLAEALFGHSSDRFTRVLVQADADVQRVRAWIEQRPQIRFTALGGISLGGIIAALVGGIEADFPRLIPILAGGDLPRMLAAGSPEARGVKRELRRVGLKLEDLLARWEVIEPLRFAGRVERSTVLMINARGDRVIPAPCTTALWKAFGRPRIEWFEGGHVTVGINLVAILEAIVDHLER